MIIQNAAVKHYIIQENNCAANWVSLKLFLVKCKKSIIKIKDSPIEKSDGINKCCGNIGYNDRTQVCCMRNSPQLIENGKSDCCGSLPYSPLSVSINDYE